MLQLNFTRSIVVYHVMKHLLSILILAIFSNIGDAQTDITGYWINTDDEDGQEKSVIQIYRTQDGTYEAKVVELLPAATLKICSACPGDKKDQPILGMVIFWDLKPYKDYYSYGQIMDPKSGKVYKLNVSREGNQLEVRGYIGISAVGRSQYWKKTNWKG